MEKQPKGIDKNGKNENLVNRKSYNYSKMIENLRSREVMYYVVENINNLCFWVNSKKENECLI